MQDNRLENFSVLIIDDDPIDNELLSVALQSGGYSILRKNNGSDGFQCAVREKPNLILLDIVMPGENGFDVITNLKSNKETSSIPVIFITGEGDVESKIRGFDLGAVDYIVKPFSKAEVTARVRLHLKLNIATNGLIAAQAEKINQIHEAQSSILPNPKNNLEANFGVSYISKEEAGGDFYDVLTIADHIFGYFVGDVAGHDLKTGFYTPFLKALLSQNCISVYEPIESLNIINNVLYKILPEERFVTGCYAKLNREAMTASIVHAGHPPTVYIPKNGHPRFVTGRGDLMGAYDKIALEQITLEVHSGDRFFLYTDGLFDCLPGNLTGEQIKKNFLKNCAETNSLPLQDSVNALVKKITADKNKTDDTLLLGIEV